LSVKSLSESANEDEGQFFNGTSYHNFINTIRSPATKGSDSEGSEDLGGNDSEGSEDSGGSDGETSE
jgi:hypothetical protein